MKDSDCVVVAERIAVRADRMVFDVRFAPQAHTTTPALAQAVAAAFPTVPHHACVHKDSPSAPVGPAPDSRTFASVMHDTPLPHLLEHLIIDAQVHDSASPADFSFVGTSEWRDEAVGRARVQVSFADDLVALRAFQRTLRFLNETVVL